MGFKKLLKLACLTMKFHNCHHTNEGETGLAVSAVLGPNHVQELYNFKRLDEVGNWRTWQPAKFKSNDGASFFLCCAVVNKVKNTWC